MVMGCGWKDHMTMRCSSSRYATSSAERVDISPTPSRRPVTLRRRLATGARSSTERAGAAVSTSPARRLSANQFLLSSPSPVSPWLSLPLPC